MQAVKKETVVSKHMKCEKLIERERKREKSTISTISSCKRREREYFKSIQCRILGSVFQQYESVRDEQKEKRHEC